MRKILLLFLLVLGVSSVRAADETYETSSADYDQTTVPTTMDLIWSFKLNASGGTTSAVIVGVKNANGTANPSGALTIPTSVIKSDTGVGYIVKKLDDGAFANQIGITAVSIPVTIQEIGTSVFAGCTVLSEITVDENNPWFTSVDGVLYDKDRTALIACPATAESLSLPSSLTSIAATACANCHRLTSITIPASVATIGSSAFTGCTLLESLTFKGDAPTADATICDAPADVTVYKESTSTGWDVAPWTSFKAIRNTTAEVSSKIQHAEHGSLTWYYRIVADGAELYNNGDAVIPTGATQTYWYDSENKIWVGEGTLTLPSMLGGHPVTRIGKHAFRNCASLTTVVIPSSVSVIDDYAFEGCDGIEEISLPATLTELGVSPFTGTWISSLVLPAKLTTLRGNPVAGCENLDSLTVDAKNRNFIAVDNVLYNRKQTRLYGVQTFVEKLTVPASIAWIATNAFSSCTLLSSVTYEGNAPKLDDGGISLYKDTDNALISYAATGTTGWDGTSTTNMPTDTQWPLVGSNRRAIKSLYSPSGSDVDPSSSGLSVTDAAGITWYYRLVGGVAEIHNEDASAIKSTTAITSLTLPTTLGGYLVKGLGTCALANLRGITTLDVPSTYEWIGNSAFSNCTSLAQVSIPKGIRTIGKAAFFGTAITSLEIPAGVSTLDGNPGLGAKRLSAFTVSADNPDFTAVDGVLYDKEITTLLACPALTTELTLPETVTALADDAFAGCTRLKTINALGDEPAADDAIFAETPTDLTIRADAYGRQWSEPTASTWKNRPFVNTGSGHDGIATVTDDSGCVWTYTIDGAKLSLGAYGATPVIPMTTAGEISVPEKLANRTVTEIPEQAFANCGLLTKITIPAGVTNIAATAFNSCTSLVEIAVAADNPAFASKYRCLYSKDGKTLVRVPAATRFAATQSQTTTGQKKDIVEILGEIDTSTGLLQSNTIITKKAYGKSTDTLVYTFTPALSADQILAGVARIADYAFSDCGRINEGTAVSGTLTTKKNGSLDNKQVGTFSLPFTTDADHSAESTNVLSSAAGFYQGNVCFYRTATFGTTAYTTDVPLVIPATVTSVSASAFDNAHFTSVSHNVPKFTGSLALTRLGGTSDVYGPLMPGVSVSLDMADFAGCSASGLPAGLKWTKATGVLAGIPTKPGTYEVTFKQTAREGGRNKTITQTATVRVADYPTMALSAAWANALTGENEALAAGHKLSFYVGVSQQFALTVADDLAGAQNTITAKGLPAGLKIAKVALKDERNVITNYAYTISGAPTKVQTSKPVTLAVSNKYKWSGALDFELEILALPNWIAGSYTGVRYDTSSNAFGAASATLSTTGKLSGKFLVPSDDLKSGKSYTFSAASLTAYDAETDAFLGTATMKIGKTTYELPFAIMQAEDGTGHLELKTPDGQAELVQNIWNRTDLKAPAYTKGMKVTVDGISFKYAAKGVVTWSGIIEDDNGNALSVSGTSQLLNDKILVLYVAPKKNLLGGICQLIELP